MKKKLLRLTTSDISLDSLIKGQLNFMSQFYEVVGVSNNTGKLEAVAQRERVRTVEIPMHREIAPLADLKCLWLLYRLFLRERPYILHANTPKGSLLAMIAGMFARVPHRIYTVTGLRYQGARGMLRKVLMTMERLTCLCANKVIPEGAGVKKALEADHITHKPLKIVLNGNINGIDTAFFAPKGTRAERRTALNLAETDFAFIFIGRIVADKGMNELATCMRRLESTHPHCKLILVGNFETDLDPLSDDNEQFFKTAPNIRFVGFQNDVRPYLEAADALVFPSYREGFPNVVMQAGAMSLPAIVTDINGCNEIIVESRNGRIIPPRDADALHKMMLFFVDNPREIQKMATQAREMICTRYEQHDVWQALLEEYRNLE